MAVVRLPSQREFTCLPGSTILDSARQQGVVLEYSCKTGRCGICKAMAFGSTTVVRNEESALSQADVDAGYILTCCRSALSDVALDAADLSQFSHLKTKTTPCRVDSLRYLAEDVVEVVLRLPPNGQFLYLPGQYVDIIGKQGIRRSYSIANAPRPDGKLEFQIRRVPQGVFSQYWFEEVQANDLLRLEGPLGTFALRDSSASNIIFLATGTGIAPVKAMYEQLASSRETYAGKKVLIYWGGRKASDIYWAPGLPDMSLSFSPLLSQEDPGWLGRMGYVQDALVDDKIELADSVVYACGSDTMITSAKTRLLSLGLPRNNFYSDAFVSSN